MFRIEPDDIITIDKSLPSSNRLSSINDVQTIISELGSQENLRLVHFIRGRTVLFIEGKDSKYLKIIASKIGLQQFAQEQGFNIVPLSDSFSSWDRFTNVNWLFDNIFGERIRCCMLLDRDYHSDWEIEQITNTLNEGGVTNHIWSMKELENYAININSLYRAFSQRYLDRYKSEPSLPISEFTRRVFSIFEQQKENVLAQLITFATRNKPDRSIDDSTITKTVLETFNANWGDEHYRISKIPGKEFFTILNRWLTSEYQISIPIPTAFFYLHAEEISPELRSTLSDFINLANKE